MQNADKGNAERLDGKDLHIGIVQARFNANITNALAKACLQALADLGVEDENITHILVPGALEIPVALQALAEQNNFDALVAIGYVNRRETYHIELVANESSSAVARVSLEDQRPIANAILTTENIDQAITRQNGKGREAAYGAVEMANLLESLS